MQLIRKFLAIFLMLVSCNIFANHLITLSLPAFDAIQTDGNFNINFVTGRPQQVQIEANARPYVIAQVEDNTLMLSLAIDPATKKPIVCPPITVEVAVPFLSRLSLAGATTLIANDINGNFSIIAGDNSRITLNGIVNVKNIQASGNSVVRLRWVNAGELKVCGTDTARIFLAGTTQVLEARMSGYAFLDAKYLRPKVALVRTQDDATAEVLSTYSLYTFAYGDSNIYFYKKPGVFLESSTESGDILQLGRWR